MQSTDRERLAVIGAGDLGACVLRLAKDIPGLHVVGFYDDFRTEDDFHGVPVLGGLGQITRDKADGLFDSLFVAIGYRHMAFRKSLFLRLEEQGLRCAAVVHPSCTIAAGASVGAGSLLFPGCTLDAGVRVGRNCVLNAGVTIAHDSVVGDHAFLGPAVTLAGFVHVGESCFLGVGTTVIDNVRIEPAAHTGGGTVVIDDLPGGRLYVGVPARPIKILPPPDPAEPAD